MISLACACTHHGAAVEAQSPTADVREFAALAWAPDQPTYLWTAHSVTDAQRSIDDVIDSFGMLSGATAEDAGRALEHLLSVDPLSATGTQRLGVDPAGSIAMFSDGLDPTIVVQLASPDTTRAFFDSVKATNGVATQSIIVDGIEVSTVKLFGHVRASWAIDKTWLWTHFAFGADRSTGGDGEWFTKAHHAHTGAWAKSFGWAKDLRAKLAAKASGLLGFFDTRALLAIARAHAPKDVLACLDRLQPIGIAGFAIDGDGHHASGRLAFDLGPAAAGIAGALLAPPPGFAALASTAPIALQWNLDVGAIAHFIAPCASSIGGDTDFLTKFGIRTARVAVLTLDPAQRSGTGVVAADLGDATYLRGMLDQIPHRSMLESDHTYGAIPGHRISIPFLISLDYVLTDRLGMLAVGDGLMDKLVATAPSSPPPVLALDLIVPGLSEATWQFVITHATNEWFAKRATSLLQRWHDGHLRVTIDHDALVIEASGNRR
jgi:hypothetical protein